MPGIRRPITRRAVQVLSMRKGTDRGEGSDGTGNAKKMHYALGLGDGNMNVQQGLRGTGNKRMGRKRERGVGDEDLVSSTLRNPGNTAIGGGVVPPSEEKNARNHRGRNPFRSVRDDLRSGGGTAVGVDVLDDIEIMDYLRAEAERRAAVKGRDDLAMYIERDVSRTASPDGPWQLSVVMLLGLIGVLVGLFIHFSTDPSGQPPYLRTRMKKKIHLHRPSYRKKTDEWSEDEEAYEEDHYGGDNESTGGTTTAGASTGGTIAKKRINIPPSPVPKAPNDPTARLYYPLTPGDNFRQQEHRQRKSTTQQMVNNDIAGSVGGNGGVTRPGSVVSVFHSPPRPTRSSASISSINNRGSLTSGSSKYEKCPSMGRTRVHNAITISSSTNRNKAATVTVRNPFSPPLPPFPTDNSGLGSGLEGFEYIVNSKQSEGDFSPVDNSTSENSEADNNWKKGSFSSRKEPIDSGDSPLESSPYSPIITGHPIVKPMGPFTPSSSFALMPSPPKENNATCEVIDLKQQTELDKVLHTPPDLSRVKLEEKMSNPVVPSAQSKHIDGIKIDSPSEPLPSPLSYASEEEGNSTPLVSLDNHDTPLSPSPSSLPSYGLFDGNTSGEFSELPTPRVDHTKGKRELARMILKQGKSITEIPLPVPVAPGEESNEITLHNNALDKSKTISMEGDRNNDPVNVTSYEANELVNEFPDLPLVPSLTTAESKSDEFSGETSPSSFHFDAPRSVLLEELQLVRMESGVSGPKWRTKYGFESNPEGESLVQNNVLPDRHQSASIHDSSSLHEEQNHKHPMFKADVNHWYELPDTATKQHRQECVNMEKLREASIIVDPADDPRNSIQHIRKDLTTSSDASSSLSSKITFSELRLEDVIGGGGFGQVWRAKWKGTPVAVKVLTGSAQAEMVPKSVLEEFIAEINMVSGMRHPNICLFMGACLDPPNRAIVTELCQNGSLWDALRSPLASPYHVADGVTRTAWPLNLYEPMSAPPMHRNSPSISDTQPPIAPGGAWPWVLVKRVAAGAARGMTYLHSGNPPVLHRDLKSANILLDDSYTAKLADFGLSRLKAVRSGMTGNCGTVQWMAPEVLCNEDYAEPADVFSFGIILWEMLTKECPYNGMTPIQCALSVLNENKRPETPKWCPQPFQALIKNCVERDPKNRPTFPQILAALDALP